MLSYDGKAVAGMLARPAGAPAADLRPRQLRAMDFDGHPVDNDIIRFPTTGEQAYAITSQSMRAACSHRRTTGTQHSAGLQLYRTQQHQTRLLHKLLHRHGDGFQKGSDVAVRHARVLNGHLERCGRR